MKEFFTFNHSTVGYLHTVKGVELQDNSTAQSLIGREILTDLPFEEKETKEEQEKIAKLLDDNQVKMCMAVVGDGHGDPACCRSAKGSEFVVNATVECFKGLVTDLSIISAESASSEKSQKSDFRRPFSIQSSETESETESKTESKSESEFDIKDMEEKLKEDVRVLTNSIVSNWYGKVDEHYENFLKENNGVPLTEEELQKVGTYAELYTTKKRLAHLYGTTLIAALWFDDFLLLLQQGDGQCTVLLNDGSMIQPIPADSRCFGNVTTSMCDEDAADSIRHYLFMGDELSKVAGVFLGSDGVEDSYRNIEGNNIFYKDLLAKALGFRFHREKLEQHLTEELPEFSKKGAGDDTSTSGIVCLKYFPERGSERQKENLEKEVQIYEIEEKTFQVKDKLNSMTRKLSILEQQLKDHEEESKKTKVRPVNAEKFMNEYQEYHQKFYEHEECLAELEAEIFMVKNDREATPADLSPRRLSTPTVPEPKWIAIEKAAKERPKFPTFMNKQNPNDPPEGNISPDGPCFVPPEVENIKEEEEESIIIKAIQAGKGEVLNGSTVEVQPLQLDTFTHESQQKQEEDTSHNPPLQGLDLQIGQPSEESGSFTGGFDPATQLGQASEEESNKWNKNLGKDPTNGEN